MSLFVVGLLLVIGIVLLLLGGHYLVEAGISLGERFGLPEFLIGLTVLTIGTSLPELFVSVTAGFDQLAGGVELGNLVMGEIIGSAVGQIGLVLGVAGVLGTLSIKKTQLGFQGLFLVGSVALVWFFSLDRVFSRGEAIGTILIYLSYLLVLSMILPRSKIKPEKHRYPLVVALGQLVVGLGMLLGGSRLVVSNGVTLAETTFLSQSLVGILIIGLGTSLPELVVTVTASAKKARDLSVGNIIGSNIFDVMVALSSGALIVPFSIEPALVRFDLPFLLLISVIVVLFFLSRQKLQAREAWLLIGLYVAYVGLKVFAVV